MSVQSMVRDFVQTHKRGCPTFHLRAAGFSTGDINKAKEAKLIEGGKGKDGGFFPYGEVPEAKGDSVSLKAEMASLLTDALNGKTLDREKLTATLDTYKVELAERQKAAEKARAAKAK